MAKDKKQKRHPYSIPSIVAITIILVIVSISIVIFKIIDLSHTFTRIITIKSKLAATHNIYKIYDTNDDVYEIENIWLRGFTKSAQLFGKLEVGKTYTVKCVGYLIPALNRFPHIIKIG